MTIAIVTAVGALLWCGAYWTSPELRAWAAQHPAADPQIAILALVALAYTLLQIVGAR